MEGIFSLQEVTDGRVPPLLPEHLMPSFFGLHWGATFAGAAELLADSIVRQQPEAFLIASKSIAGTQLEFDLYFYEGALSRINADLYVSESFWEPEDEEERLRLRLDHVLEDYYSQLVEYYVEIVGSPAFSGRWSSPGFPKDELAKFLTLWNLHDGEFRVEFEHAEKELPIIVRLSSRALRNGESP